MTPDTEIALKAIGPLAKALRIDVSADDDGHLKINNTLIGIACNSTYATIMEFVGYVFLQEWVHDRYYKFNKKGTENDIRNAVRDYWIDKVRAEEIKGESNGFSTFLHADDIGEDLNEHRNR